MPWQMSHAAYTESESAELQTDVMRFMAILAFCLVAIFAIVQSIPATPAPVAGEVVVASPAPAPGLPAPASEKPPSAMQMAPRPEPARPVELKRAKPAPRPRAVEPVPLRRALPATPRPRSPALPAVVRQPPRSEAVQAPEYRPPASPAAETGEGLSLRFESDAVLRSLVARGLVNLYAISGGAYYEMTVAGSDVRFRPGAAPSRYHEMIADTVPYDVRRSFSAGASPVTWGVTLPAATSQQLARFVRTNYSGSLVITADAQLALNGA